MALEVSLRACRSRVKGFQTRYKPSPALRASARKVWVPWIEDPRLRKLRRLRKEMRPCSDPGGGMIQGPSKGEGPSKGGLEIREGAGYENKGVTSMVPVCRHGTPPYPFPPTLWGVQIPRTGFSAKRGAAGN